MRFYLFPALSLLCTYGMVGCAYYGFLCTGHPMISSCMARCP